MKNSVLKKITFERIPSGHHKISNDLKTKNKKVKNENKDIKKKMTLEENKHDIDNKSALENKLCVKSRLSENNVNSNSNSKNDVKKDEEKRN